MPLTTIEKVIRLQSVESFAEVPTDQLANLALISEEVTLAAGEPVYREEEPSDAMYLVLEGQVRLHRQNVDVTIAGPGDVFGAWALFDEEPQVATATPLEETLVIRIMKEDFIDLLADHVQITQGILKGMVKRLRGLLGRVSSGPTGEGPPRDTA